MVEVLIAGAGPAGALAALILARAGVRVLVVDRARFPRDKLCGDTLNPGALRLLARHGLAAPIVARGLPIEGMLVTSGTGVRVRGVYGPGVVGRSLVRRELDQWLIEAAVRAGAQFQDGVRVAAPMVEEEGGGRLPASARLRVRGATLVTREGRSLRVPAIVTVAADGRRSGLAFALGLARQPAWPRRWAIGGYMTGVDGLDTVGEMHIRRGHYIGVAPLPDGLTNVCCVSPSRRALANPERALLSQLAADPLLRDRMARARLTGPVTMMGPLAVDVPAAGLPGLLLAGDAAGFIDPMTGDGLRFALRGAELAAQVALRMLDSWPGDAARQEAASRVGLQREPQGESQRESQGERSSATPPAAWVDEGRRAARADVDGTGARRPTSASRSHTSGVADAFDAGAADGAAGAAGADGADDADGAADGFAAAGTTGALAADLDLRADGRDGYEMLTAWRGREFAMKHRVNRTLRALVSSDYGVRAGTLGARLAPGVLRRIIRYAGDDDAVAAPRV